MIHIKNNNFQDLSKYIPEQFREGKASCLQTRYSQEDAETMVSTINHLAKDVFSLINPNSQTISSFLPLPEDDDTSPLGPRIVWTNKYGPEQGTAIHNHSDNEFTKNATHYAIYVIAVGTQPETLSFFEGDVRQDIVVTPGDLFVGHHTELHGAAPVKKYLCAMMFKINANL